MGEELDVPIKSYTPKDDQNTYINFSLFSFEEEHI
jgi:hypothetical protein